MARTQSGKDLAAVRITRKGATIHKTNERPGTHSQARYIRISAYKAREVLDLIRGKHVEDADQILEFVERDVAQVVRKCLASAVANAQNNDSQDPDALYVSACFADEGPTLKRWRPRARGRATRIRKRTCHITIIVSRLSEAEIRRRTERESAAQASTGGRRPTQTQAASRRARVAKSRQQERRAEHDHGAEDEDEPTSPVPGEPTEATIEAAQEADEAATVNVEGPVVEMAEPPAEPDDEPIVDSTAAAMPAEAEIGEQDAAAEAADAVPDAANDENDEKDES